ncbi:MAG: hypothetical protein C4302_02405, partial [Thermus sp.]
MRAYLEARVDPTEIPRPKAKHTPYVGRLKDGELGFMAFTLAQPYQGRAIPVYMGIYSAASPLGEHWEAFRDLKGYLRMEGVMSKTLGHATAYLENAE